MNKFLLSALLTLATLPAAAQSTATLGKTDVGAERTRLAAERAAVEKAFVDQRAVCFKRFAVEDCLTQSRRQKRSALEHIKRQEALLNDAERKRRGGLALDRLEEQAAAQRSRDAAGEREKALKSQQDREQRAADHAASRAGLAAQEGANAKQFADKQRAYAERQARQAARSAEAPNEAKLQQDKVRKAEAHRVDVERRNAGRAKPRSAPLPPPPP